MNILIIPDKFKYSLTAQEVCNAVEEGIKKYLPQANIIKIPLADGGEGSLSVLEQIINFNRVYLEVKNPLFEPITAYYGLLNDTAYIEMAKASGLQLLAADERNPMHTTSFGMGEMILDAIKKGVKKIYLFVGGSATNDAGMGIASALGYVFSDENHNILSPIGANLVMINSIDNDGIIPLDKIEVKVLTDVTNPLFGESGAASVFAAQKGATEKEIKILDSGLRNYAKITKLKFGIDVSEMPGSGAAGGVGAGAIVFCNAQIVSGIDSILDLLNINDYIEKSDFIITGEGLLDKQTLEGKVVKGVIDRCRKFNKPLGIVCGDMTLTGNEIRNIYPAIIKKIRIDNISKKEAIVNAYNYLVKISEEMIKEFSQIH